MRFRGPAAPFHADVVLPGDKSLSHRALLLGGMAAGRSRIEGLAPGADVAATVGALRRLGVSVTGDTVASPGVARWTAPAGPIDARNSATTMRLLAGALAGRPFTATIVGDRSLMRRPMARLVPPLEALGAVVEVSADGTAPIVVTGGRLHGAGIELPIASAQVRTASALAALQAEGATLLSSPPGYRDHTERWLTHLGLGSTHTDGSFEVRPGPVPPIDVDLPGDPSSAAFLWVAAAIQPGSTVRTRTVSLNPGRLGLLDALRAMGASVTVEPGESILGDAIGDVTVTGSDLRGVEIGGVDTTRTLDELPVLAVAAAHAADPTRVTGAGELRGKESDRIEATVSMIRSLGGRAEPLPDGFLVMPGALRGGRIDSEGDHRIAMAAAVAATRGTDVEVEGFDAVGVSWPRFAADLEAVWSSR